MSSVNKINYNSDQITFYAACRLGWSSYIDHIASFTAASPKYTTSYATEALEAVEAAASLPNVDQRRSGSKSINRKLQVAAKKGTASWKMLKRYIINSFPAEQVEPMIMAAGGNFYASATHDNWNDMDEMLAMAVTFISTNGTTLSKEGKGMPAAFPAEFTVVQTNYKTVLQEYGNTKKAANANTSAKTIANNAVYATLMDMLDDGKVIFDDKPELKKQFTFSALKKIAGKNGKTGLRISVKESVTMLPVTTATIHFQPGNTNAFVNAKGVASVRLPKGIYTYTVTTPGYTTVYGTIEVTAGTVHRLDLMVQKEIAVA